MSVRLRRSPALVIFACLAALAAVPERAHADQLADDLKARRARLMDRLGPEAVFIAWSAPTRLYSLDVDYEYRQDSNLLYLTGIDQEDTILVLLPGHRSRREILFVRESNPRREHWNGHSLTPEEASAASGIETVLLTPQFDRVIESVLDGRSVAPIGDPGAIRDALAGGRAKLSLLLEPRPGLRGPITPVYEFVNRARERFFGFTVTDATPHLAALRQVKTPYEQIVLARSVEISADAHLAGMRAARPGRFEYEVEAAIEFVYLSNGAMSPGYPSIVGSGPNATILHYSQSSRQTQAGDLLLVDAAANYRGLTGDITRTYPVSGTFSPAQKAIYRIVLAAQEAGMKAAVAGARTADIQKAAEAVARQGLLEIGLITDATGNQFRTWWTHGIVHWIGMDVHDVGDAGAPLAPGMAFVIEPGLYIRESALDALPNTPENDAFVAKVRPVVQQYKDIGVRVEDSFLLTEAGLTRLSAKVPRTVEDIEAFMRGSTR
jgi:Xaa-Pro aminopeptidase